MTGEMEATTPTASAGQMGIDGWMQTVKQALLSGEQRKMNCEFRWGIWEDLGLYLQSLAARPPLKRTLGVWEKGFSCNMLILLTPVMLFLSFEVLRFSKSEVICKSEKSSHLPPQSQLSSKCCLGGNKRDVNICGKKTLH